MAPAAAGGVAVIEAGALGTAGIPAGPLVAALAFGTVLVVAVAVVLAEASGAAFSLPHSIHNRVATANQAKSRKARVWFMGSRQAQPTRRVGTGLGGWGLGARRTSSGR